MDNIEEVAVNMICKYTSRDLNSGIYKYKIEKHSGSCMQNPVNTFFCSALQLFINSEISIGVSFFAKVINYKIENEYDK